MRTGLARVVGAGQLSSPSAVRAGPSNFCTDAGVRQQHCTYTFSDYQPSVWEKEWLDAGEGRQNSSCQTMQQDISLAEAWMTTANESFYSDISGIAGLQGSPGVPSEVFSYFEYSSPDTGCAPLRVPIEPLVGLLRHPLVLKTCVPAGRDDRMVDVQQDVTGRPNYHIQNKGYMLINPIAHEDWERMYTGRTILVDIGTGRYLSGSLPWFTQIYRQRGIEFDDIFGWEIKPVAAAQYWADVPLQMRGRMHYFNIPCDVEPDSPFNPLNIIRNMYQPGDFVVLKLDIDTEQIEQAVMDQLRDDPNLQNMIAEMYFEQHFEAPEMWPYFGQNLTTKLADVQQLFYDFRSRGLRLHYWP